MNKRVVCDFAWPAVVFYVRKFVLYIALLVPKPSICMLALVARVGLFGVFKLIARTNAFSYKINVYV